MKAIHFLILSFSITLSTYSPAALAQGIRQDRELTPERSSGLITKALAENSNALMLAKIAIRKAQSAELADISNNIMRDIQGLNAELTAYANRHDLATDLDKTEKLTDKIRKRDSQETGPDLDEDLIEDLTDAQKGEIEILEDLKNRTNDPELRKIAERYLSVLYAHQDRLVPLKEQIKEQPADEQRQPADNREKIHEAHEKDTKFLSGFRVMNHYELRLTELTMKKGNHRELKNAAQKMYEDHLKTEQDLKAYTERGRYRNSSEETSDVREKISKWQQKKGGMEWDADIIEELIDVHKDGIDFLEDAATDVEDPELKDLIKKTIPLMRKHLSMLEPLKETVKKPWKQ